MGLLRRFSAWMASHLVATTAMVWVLFLAAVYQLALRVQAGELWTARQVPGVTPHSDPLQFMIVPSITAVGSITTAWVIARQSAARRSANHIQTDS